MYSETRKDAGKEPAGLSTYMNIFKSEFNLSIHKRSNDRCGLCHKYMESSAHKKESLQEEYDAHIKSKENVFKEKRKG